MAIGKTGLERKLDEQIIGKVGYQRYEVNAFEKRIREIKIDEGQAGKSFKTRSITKYKNILMNS